MKEVCMKSRYVFAVSVMLLTEICSASSDRLIRSSLLQQNKDSHKVKRVEGVSFELDKNTVFEITPRKPKLKKGKPGSLFSHAAAPAALKKDAQAALAALAQAKAAVVLSPCDEKTRVRSTRSELSNAKARQEAPMKINAAQETCQRVLDELNTATVTATRLNPVKRTNAFRVSKHRK